MKRVNRIRKSKDFKEVIGKHQKIQTNEFIIYLNLNKLGYLRVGISVSSKIGNAVRRNYIKRQIRNIVGELFDLSRSYDVVIIAKDGFKLNDYHQNLEQFKKYTRELQ